MNMNSVEKLQNGSYEEVPEKFLQSSLRKVSMEYLQKGFLRIVMLQRRSCKLSSKNHLRIVLLE